MKRNILYIFITIFACMLSVPQANAQERSYDGTIRVMPVRLEQRGDFLHIDLNIILENVKVKTARGVDLIPLLVSPDKSLTLPKVSFKGANEYLAYERTLTLMSKKEKAAYEEPYAVEKGNKWKNDTLPYRHMLPYEPWMAGARVDMQYDRCGCGETALMDVENVGLITLEPIPYTVIPHMAFVQPEAEEIKRREIQAEAFLDFQVNKINIRPEYMNNPRELAKIYRMIDDLKADPSIQVNRLDIIGFASPEGTWANNKRLSEGRAGALRDYLAAQYEFPRNLYHIEFGGENWDGLVAALDTLNLQYKDEVLNIIQNVPADQARKKKLIELRDGVPYFYLLKNIYPRLRVAICRVGYNIKNFDINEAKEVIKKRPQNLSLNEMFLVANTYPEGSQEFIDVFETAVRMYPEDEVANLNAATSAILRNDLITAERYMSRVTPTYYPAEYYNTIGVLELLKENYDKAEEYLNMAADLRLENAKLNLEELTKKRNNIIALERNKQ